MTYTYAGLYGPEALIDASGDAEPVASVTVLVAGTSTKATIFSDNARAALSNPLPTNAATGTIGAGIDILGNASFYAEPGLYDLQVTAGGQTRLVRIGVGVDPAEVAAVSSAVTAAASAVTAEATARAAADTAVAGAAAADATSKANAAQSAAIAAAATDATTKANAAQSAATTAAAADATSKMNTRAPVSATWQANTAYKAGQVVSYLGTLYTAIADFTSTGSFVAANWTLASSGAYAAASRAALALIRNLDTGGTSQAIQTVSDSTGTSGGGGIGATTWPYRIASALAARYPAYTVQTRTWNDTAQVYNPPATVQTGAAGVRGLQVASAGAFYTGPSIVGDLDVAVQCAPTSWKAGAGITTFASKWGAAGGWRFQLGTDGTLYLVWSTTGSDTILAGSTSTVPFTGSATGWVRAVLDVDNDASGRTVSFYTSTDGFTWSALGAPVTAAGVTSIFDNTAVAYELGSYAVTVGVFAGTIYEAWIRNGITGYTAAPVLPESWGWRGTPAVYTTVGAPILTVLVGGIGGVGISYFDDATRRPKLLPHFGPQMTYLVSSHNENVTVADDWLALYGAWISNVQARLPYTTVVLGTQNKETAPRTAALITAHVRRRAGLMRLATQQRLDMVDAYRVVTSLQSDGLHPDDVGYAQWAAEAMLQFPAPGS